MEKGLCFLTVQSDLEFLNNLVDGVGAMGRPYYVSQFTVESYCFADGRCLFKQPQSVL